MEKKNKKKNTDLFRLGSGFTALLVLLRRLSCLLSLRNVSVESELQLRNVGSVEVKPATSGIDDDLLSRRVQHSQTVSELRSLA